MVDNDGGFKYGKIVALNIAAESQLSIFPNPANNKVTVSHAKASADASLDVVAADGKRVLALKPRSNSVKTLLDASLLKPGTYTIVYKNNGVHWGEIVLVGKAPL